MVLAKCFRTGASAAVGTMRARSEREDRRVDGGAGFFVSRVRSMSRAERRTMVMRAHRALSLSRQCRLLSIGRSLLYYTPKGESPETLALMRRIDELFLKYPFYGARQMVRQRWRHHYNTIRPHSSLGYRPPAPETILPNVDGPTYAVDGLRVAHQLNPRQTLT